MNDLWFQGDTPVFLSSHFIRCQLFNSTVLSLLYMWDIQSVINMDFINKCIYIYVHIFITDCIYGHHKDRLRKNCNNNDFTPFYFKLVILRF